MYKTYSNYVFYRNKANLNDSAVSKLSGVSASTISDWKNERHQPTMKNLSKIASALGITTDDFFSGLPTEQVYSDNNTNSVIEPNDLLGSAAFLRKAISYCFTLRSGEKVELSVEEFQELNKAIEIYIESWIKLLIY